MAHRERECDECGKTFVAKSSRAKFCKTSCRVKASRRPSKTGANATEKSEAPATLPPAVGGLISQVAADLGKAQALDTIPGRAALALAYRIESPMESGAAAAAMTRELSRLVAEAMVLTEGRRRDAGDDVDDRVASKLRLVSGG